MAYLAAQLVAEAYYLAGIVSRGYETVSGEQLSDGIEMLNELLAIKTTDGRMIPYFTYYEFDATPGDGEYLIPNLISIETITFNLGDVRFSMNKQSRQEFFGTPRVDGIQTLPFNWHLERSLTGAKLFLYFVPSSDYPIKIWGKFALGDVTADQDLSLTLSKFYIAYLKYGLGEYICNQNLQTFPEASQRKLNEYEAKINDISPTDFTLQKTSTMGGQYGINWGLVNFPGWVP